MVITAAYGRFYQTETEVMEDWGDGLDFKIVGGPYMSIRDKVNIMDSIVFHQGKLLFYIQFGIV